MSVIRGFDREDLRRQYRDARPFPFFKIDGFLEPSFAEEVAASYPSFDQALGQGKTFATVNERKKVQITDAKLFPAPVQRLNDALASTSFLDDLSYITGIPTLLADAELAGGGIHVTGPGGRLDVHVDFNLLEERKLHRRINLLLYLNPVWEDAWGGHIQLWDRDVKTCAHQFVPSLNRCVVFETSEYSYHGVTPVQPSAPVERRSFATYYYTREAPPKWEGKVHDTIFRARPEERLRGLLLMPAEKLRGHLRDGARRVSSGVKRLLGALPRVRS